jgi:hypothetical protein
MGVTTTGPDVFRALYYPFSRTISEATLKRAVLLYDEILFVDPMSPRVRAGLYKAEEHLPYLPANVATSMEQEWTGISGRYELLQREGVLRLVDPADVVTDPVAEFLNHPLVPSEFGPVLHPDDVAAGKTTALDGRAEVRDAIDVDGLLS